MHCNLCGEIPAGGFVQVTRAIPAQPPAIAFTEFRFAPSRDKSGMYAFTLCKRCANHWNGGLGPMKQGRAALVTPAREPASA